ncbi:MAG: hypothetical protein AAF492_29665, partial [Verrucomicrobiota bacterium]
MNDAITQTSQTDGDSPRSRSTSRKKTAAFDPRPPIVRALITFGLLTVISFPVWLMWNASTFPGLNAADILHNAQVSRNLMDGKGFTTSVIHPISLQAEPRVDKHPDLLLPPLYPMWQAIWFLIFEPNPKASAVASGTGWFLTLLVLFGFTQQLFGRKAAWICVVLYLLNPA